MGCERLLSVIDLKKEEEAFNSPSFLFIFYRLA